MHDHSVGGKTPLDLAAEERIPEIVEVEGLLRVSSIVMQ
jgi:hypothetical protein